MGIKDAAIGSAELNGVVWANRKPKSSGIFGVRTRPRPAMSKTSSTVKISLIAIERINWKAVPPIGVARLIEEFPTRGFPRAIFEGECSVQYIVDGRRYTLWAASGYLDPDARWVADKVRDCPVARYSVHYNPQDPSDASAERVEVLH